MKILRTPVLLFGLPAVLLATMPALHGLFALDRAGFGSGEWWRLWTGHWIHFSASHLLWNLSVLLAAGAWIERVRPGLLLRYTAAAAPLIGLGVLFGEPALQTYGGLSGLATGVVVLLGLHQLRTPDSSRWLWAGLLAAVAIKAAGDLTGTGPLLAAYGEPEVRSSSVAHIAGAIVALLQFIVERVASDPGCSMKSRTPASP